MSRGYIFFLAPPTKKRDHLTLHLKKVDKATATLLETDCASGKANMSDRKETALNYA